jgi:hypothetical protein
MANQDHLTQILKEQMRDVHLPAEISWWPPAPGWWLLACLTTLLGFLIVRLIRDRKRRMAYRKHAVSALKEHYQRWQETGSTTAYLQAANAILKRCVLHITGTKDAAGLSGQAWLNTLSDLTPHDLSIEAQDALALKVYQAESSIDVALIHAELEEWLRSHKINKDKPSAPESKTYDATKQSADQAYSGAHNA